MGKKIVLEISLFIFTFTAIFPYEVIGIVSDSVKTEILLKKERYSEHISLFPFGADSVRIDGRIVSFDDSISVDDRELVRSVEYFSPCMSTDSMLLFMSPSSKNILLFDEERRGLYTLKTTGLEKYESYFSVSSFLLPALTFLLIPVLYIFGKVRGADNKDIEEIYTSQIGPTFSFFLVSLLYSAAELGFYYLIKNSFKKNTDNGNIKKSFLEGMYAAKREVRLNIVTDFAISCGEFIPMAITVPFIAISVVQEKFRDRNDASIAAALWILFSILHYAKNVAYLMKDPEHLILKSELASGSKDLFYMRGYIEGINQE
ncbi:MAG: hypothetical protein AB7T10_02460 [bacterium]